MPNQLAKAQAFRALHERDRAFLIPNPWDAGSAKLLAHWGFEALATTSAGFAFTAGRADNTTSREEMLAHCAAIVSATPLPVSADLENGFGDSPDFVAETIRLAAQAGLVGASIEDMTSNPVEPIYEFDHAVDRIRAAAEAARSLPFPFTLTARCENFLVGRVDIHDTIRRLQAYQEAGADVLYAPGLATTEDVSAVVRAVKQPVNVLAVMGFSLADLSALGVKRVSVGSALARAAFGGLQRAAQELLTHGTFTFTQQAINYGEINKLFST